MQYYQQPHQIQHRSYDVFLDITTLQLYCNKTKKTSKNNNAVQIFQIQIIYFIVAWFKREDKNPVQADEV